ncbi:hypothetical protein JXA88_03910 [Candidatus Fermentibacteria bacterium]|nr:hypothetical protein [Candidatus Fermentibacteria bacterium]
MWAMVKRNVPIRSWSGANEGDEAAYDSIVRREQRAIRSAAARFLDSPNDVDRAQDCFVQAYEKLKGYRGRGSLEGWLRRIAVRLCYDRLHAAARTRVVSNGLHDAELEHLGAAVVPAAATMRKS